MAATETTANAAAIAPAKIRIALSRDEMGRPCAMMVPPIVSCSQQIFENPLIVE
jgi:hypothetical protein